MSLVDFFLQDGTEENSDKSAWELAVNQHNNLVAFWWFMLLFFIIMLLE